jgi:ribonuclease BN (tRNA processing enzyme)
MVTQPIGLQIRMYNVGFGDCFLMSFTYPSAVGDVINPDTKRDSRHILFDFGSTSRPRSRLTLNAVGEQLERDCAGRLDAVVVTHRHRDHVSGFGAASTQKIIRRLDPRLVVRSWTENPRLKSQSGKPAGAALAGPASDDAVLVARLAEAQETARRLVERSRIEGRMAGSDLVQAAQDELANAAAVEELDRLSSGRRGEYLSAKRKTRLNDIVPGVTFRVLGPPRPSDWPDVARQTQDSDEFWVAKDRQVERLFRAQPSTIDVPLGTGRWIIERMRTDEQDQLASLVRWLDDAMNNTSVVLLIDVPGHTLLFGGDAQIENWGWSLSQAKKQKLKGDPALDDALARVDLYKVGHHGSRNATPISLFDKWKGAQTPFIAMLSTKANVHGEDHHAVPRSTLVAALEDRGTLLTTDVDREQPDWVDVRAALPGGAFETVRGPLRPVPD